MKKVIALILCCSLAIILFVGYLTSTKTMKGCLAYYNNEIPKILDISGTPYTFDVKPGRAGTYQGYHFIECNISLSGDLPDQQIYELIKSVESIKKPDKAIVDYSFRNGSDRCAIEFNFCLLRGGQYVYSPIKEKKYSDLHTEEKKCICDWIQMQYDKYDAIKGKYSGDRYSNVIFQGAEELFGLSQEELKVIWMKQYDYK